MNGATGNTAPKVETVGLLFVHGIGEQKRFEHLRESVSQFAELMKQSGEPGEKIACAVVDRTADWKRAPENPVPNGVAPITMTLTSIQRHVVFHCHEVWWADLGARSDIFDALSFWIWALGQWCAPVYRELDAAQLDKVQKRNKLVSRLAILPMSVAGFFRAEPIARIRLGMAGVAALAVSVSWVLAKRVLHQLLDSAPSPTIIVQYVGDVRTYEERAVPGDTAVSDPGYPRRVGIRRRMVTEMVAMGSNQALDRWYVAAHSQGSVLAYNGLTEIGHALPNYLSKAQWHGLPQPFRSDAGCIRRPLDQLADMMPARPDWLHAEDVVSRPALFDNFGGLLTYGSPLGKFAGLWPRIVATATDRTPTWVAAQNGRQSVFPVDARWINLAAPQDPVAGDLDSFGAAKSSLLAPHVPPLESYETPYSINYLLAHLQYFDGGEAFEQSPAITQRRAVMRWLMTGSEFPATATLPVPTPLELQKPLGPVARFFAINVAYGAIVAALLLFATLFVASVGGVVKAVLGGDAIAIQHWADIASLLLSGLHLLPLVGEIVLSIVLAAGIWRWISESLYNRRVAKAAMDGSAAGATQDNWRQVTQLHTLQLTGATATAILFLAPLLWAAFCPYVPHRIMLCGGHGIHIPRIVATGVMLLAAGLWSIFLQTLINKWVPPLNQ